MSININNVFLGIKTDYIRIKGLNHSIASTGYILSLNFSQNSNTLEAAGAYYTYTGIAGSSSALPGNFQSSNYDFYVAKFEVYDERSWSYFDGLNSSQKTAIRDFIKSVSITDPFYFSGNNLILDPNYPIGRYLGNGSNVYPNSIYKLGNEVSITSNPPIMISCPDAINNDTGSFKANLVVIAVQKNTVVCDPVNVDFDFSKKPLIQVLEIEVQNGVVSFYLNNSIGTWIMDLLSLTGKFVDFLQNVVSQSLDFINKNSGFVLNSLSDIIDNFFNIFEWLQNNEPLDSPHRMNFEKYKDEIQKDYTDIQTLINTLDSTFINVSQFDNKILNYLDNLENQLGRNLIKSFNYSSSCPGDRYDIYLSPLCPDGSCEVDCGDSVSCFLPDGTCMVNEHNLLSSFTKNGINFRVFS